MPLTTKVEEVMTKNVFTVEFEDSIKKADAIMREERVKQVPVVDNQKFIGMITERTLMEYTLKQIYDYDDSYADLEYNKISEFENILAKNVHIIYPEDSLTKAIEVMSKKKLDYMAVVDWEKNLIGIITAMDILLFVNKKIQQ
jgi:CBS domain-containing protein